MSENGCDTDRSVLSRYTNQPDRMPAPVRNAVEALWDGHPIQLYAMADLDASMRLAQTWLALGPERIAVAEADNGAPPRITCIERERIESVREAPGLSCTVLTISGRPGDPALAILRYTHRQRRAMENIRFVLEQGIAGLTVEPRDSADNTYAEAVAKPVRDAQAAFANNHLAVVWRLLAYLKPYRARVIWGMAAAALMTLLALVPPFLTGYVLDHVVKPATNGAMPRAQALNMAWVIVSAVGVVFALREVFAWVRLRTMAVLGELVARDLRTDLYEHLQKLSVSYFSSKQTGSIISRVSSDTDRIWDFIAFGVVEVSLSIIMLAGLGAVLISLDWRLGLLMTLPVPLFMWGIYRHGERMNRLFLRAWRRWSALTEVLGDTIPGVRVVRAFNQERKEKKRFDTRNHDAVLSFNAIHAAWTRFWPGLMLGIHVIILAVWALAIPRMLADPEAPSTLSMGTFVSFLLYTTMFFQPIEIIGQMARMLNRATSSAHRIFEVLDTKPAIIDTPDAVRLSPVRGRVTFENVAFAYDGVRQVMKGISFEVEPGEMVGLVGPSGAGKTTITNLLVRFYEPTGGRILIDGVDLRDLDTGHFRRQVGMVLQDPFLFHGTVLENIRYGVPEATADRVVEAAKTANAHDFICKLPHGYDTMVGERGHTLSGGERQRVSIARAVLCNPRILILDEATSSVDTETERKIQEAMDRLVSGRTVFAIAHRLSTLTRATRLLVIQDGRIVEQGTHAELLGIEDGLYRKLHTMQQELHEMYAV